MTRTMTMTMMNSKENRIQMPRWIKSDRLGQKVYSITDLQLTTCADEEHSSMFANTLNKFFVRKRSHHSTLDLTRETSNEIHLIQSIGQGRFGIVFKALYHIRPNESLIVAVRKLSFVDDESLKRMKILKSLNHPNLLQYFGIVQSMIVMEYAHCQSLRQCLRSVHAKSDYPIGVLLEFFKQIISALCYLEEKSFLPENLTWQMVLVFHSSLVKLSDLDKPCRSVCHSLISAFGRLMSLCLNYGEEIIDGIGNVSSSSNNQTLARPCYASTELYQLIIQCSLGQGPTLKQLNETLHEIDLEEVRLNDFQSSFETTSLIVLDRCMTNNTNVDLLRCVTPDGQILLIESDRVESSRKTLNSIFQRRTVIKKTKMKHHREENPNESFTSTSTTNLLNEVMEAFTALYTNKESADSMTTSSLPSPPMTYSSYSSSISTDTDDSHSISSDNSHEHHRRSSLTVTGQPLPPPPDLSTLGRKLTTASMTSLYAHPIPSISKKNYSTKKRFHFFS